MYVSRQAKVQKDLGPELLVLVTPLQLNQHQARVCCIFTLTLSLLCINHTNTFILYMHTLTHTNKQTADKLKSLFGTSTKQPKPVTYDRIYATMDPVPHNANSSSPYTPQIQHGYSPAKYTEGSMPSGARM